MTLSGATNPGQNASGRSENEEIFRIPQSSSITEVSLSDCLMSYPGHQFEGPYLSKEMQSVYPSASADCVDW